MLRDGYGFGSAVLHFWSSALITFTPSQQSSNMWSGKKRQQPTGPLRPALLLFCPVASLVMHSSAILGGSYVNAGVCFWLGGTKSTLYKCTLKQLPLLPTAAPTQTSDCAAARLAYWWWERWMWTISNNVSCYEMCYECVVTYLFRKGLRNTRNEWNFISLSNDELLKKVDTHFWLPKNGSKLLQSSCLSTVWSNNCIL